MIKITKLKTCLSRSESQLTLVKGLGMQVSDVVANVTAGVIFFNLFTKPKKIRVKREIGKNNFKKPSKNFMNRNWSMILKWLSLQVTLINILFHSRCGGS